MPVIRIFQGRAECFEPRKSSYFARLGFFSGINSCSRVAHSDPFLPSQLLRRQRGAYVGFDQCDICGTDRAISIHVFAEIGHADRLPHL